MGISSLAPATQPAASLFRQDTHPANRTSSSPKRNDDHSRPANKANDGNGVEIVFQQSRMEHVSLAIQMREASARVTTENEASIETRQLAFDFFAESRYEELTLFQQRMTRVADAIEPGQGHILQTVTQRMSIRFSLSIEISATALHGMAGGAESLISERSEAFSQFLDFVNASLTRNNELLNQLMELLDGFLRDEDHFASRFQRILAGLEEAGMPGFQPPQFPTLQTGGAGARFQLSSFHMQLEFEFVAEMTFEEADPIVLDLTGDGFNLTSVHDGAYFDLLGDGRDVQTAFVTGGDAFLAIDRNGDGIIDHQDDEFHLLMLWKDNGNGITEPGELISLKDAGIREIHLAYRDVNKTIAGGNRLTQISKFFWEDGRKGMAGDVMLNYLA